MSGAEGGFAWSKAWLRVYRSAWVIFGWFVTRFALHGLRPSNPFLGFQLIADRERTAEEGAIVVP